MRAEFCIRCGSQPSPFGKIKSIMPNGRAVPRATSIAPRAGGMTSEPSSADLIDSHIVTNIVTDTEAMGCASRRLGEGKNSCVMSRLK